MLRAWLEKLVSTEYLFSNLFAQHFRSVFSQFEGYPDATLEFEASNIGRDFTELERSLSVDEDSIRVKVYHPDSGRVPLRP